MTSNKQLLDLLEQVARGEIDTAAGARASCWTRCGPGRSRIWGSRASIIIAPSARGSPKSSSA